MTVTINGTTGIANDGGYTGDGVVFADTTPANTLVTTTGGNVGIGTSSPTARLTVVTGASGNNEGEIRLSENATYYAGLRRVNASDEFRIGSYGASQNITFYTVSSERARIDSSGNLLVGKTANDDTSVGLRYVSSQYLSIVRDGNPSLYLNRLSSNGRIAEFARSNTIVGAIEVTTTNTSYVTSSDYRLKENIAPMTGALAKVAALKPVTYTWKSTGEADEGFIAHELAEVCPSAVTGEKDAVDADNNPQYQGIDTSFLVATLTAAIQELKAIVDAQGAEIAALKGTP